MKRYIKINAATGLYLTDAVVDDDAVVDADGNPITPATHIEVAEEFVLEGFGRPRWSGSAWVEGSVFDLAGAKLDKYRAVQLEQEQRLGLGFRVTVGQTELILSSDSAQQQLLQSYATALALGVAYPVGGLRLIARDGTELTANVTQFQAAFAAWRSRLTALRTRYADVVQAIRAATTRAELAAIDITAGWPNV